MLRLCAAVLAGSLASPSGVLGAAFENGPVVALHASRAFSKSLCDAPQVPIDCKDFIVNETIQDALNVYLVAARVDSAHGVSGISCGISRPASMVTFWALCADREVESGIWPLNGSGNRIEWDEGNCRRTEGAEGVQAVAGFFYVYAYENGALGITPNQAAGDSQLVLVDCSGSDLAVQPDGGIVGFGTVPGLNPCLASVAVMESTWGNLKTRYVRPKRQPE